MNQKNVLLVEDDPVLQRLFSIIIDTGGYQCHTYQGDFARVRELVDWEGIDIIVCDLILGRRVYGSDILGWLEKFQPHVWRIMITGSYKIDPEEAHCDLLLIKPVRQQQLLAALEEDRG